MRLLGMLFGLLLTVDGALACFKPGLWGGVWQWVGNKVAGPTERYLDEVVDATDEFREKTPQGMGLLSGVEMGLGALVMVLAIKRG